MMKLNKVCVPLPQGRIYSRDVDAVEVGIWLAARPNESGEVTFTLSVDCQSVIEGFTTTDFLDGRHTLNDDCPACLSVGWMNDQCEADCYRLDTIAMDAFERSLAGISELRMFGKNAKHRIESDHWTITVMRGEN